jgi:hypothetical protein
LFVQFVLFVLKSLVLARHQRIGGGASCPRASCGSNENFGVLQKAGNPYQIQLAAQYTF